MRGRLVDAWKYTWLELWEPLEQSPHVFDDIYLALYVELEKALKHRLKTSDDDDNHRIFFETSTDPIKARTFIKELDSQRLAGDHAMVVFFKNAYDVFDENSEELCTEFVRLLDEFISCHNLRYKLQYTPFKLQPHLPGVFASLFNEIADVAAEDSYLLELMKDFEHSFYTVSRSHNTTDMKTCIAKASMLVEGLGSIHPESGDSQTLGKICESIKCWPHATIRDSVSKLYGFCSNYPGIRHAGHPQGKLRELELRDSIIVPLMLLIAAGYFLPWQNISEIIGIAQEDM